jgi:hypothetical protein
MDIDTQVLMILLRYGFKAVKIGKHYASFDRHANSCKTAQAGAPLRAEPVQHKPEPSAYITESSLAERQRGGGGRKSE